MMPTELTWDNETRLIIPEYLYLKVAAHAKHLLVLQTHVMSNRNNMYWSITYDCVWPNEEGIYYPPLTEKTSSQSLTGLYHYLKALISTEDYYESICKVVRALKADNCVFLVDGKLYV